MVQGEEYMKLHIDFQRARVSQAKYRNHGVSWFQNLKDSLRSVSID
jgi:hypothetical protein